MTEMMTPLLVYTFFEWPFSVHTLVLSLGIISSSLSFFYLYQQKKIFFFIFYILFKMEVLYAYLNKIWIMVLLLHPYHNEICPMGFIATSIL